MSRPAVRTVSSRRDVYRRVKGHLRRALWRTWSGTRWSLNRALQRLLRGRSRSELLMLARRPGVAGLLLAGVSVLGGPADADAIQLSDIALNTNSGGFALHGVAALDLSGYSVSGAGDVNGDGLADLIVGAWGADPNGSYSGSSYVVFGKADGTAVELSAVAAGTGGFALHGAAQDHRSGYSVSGAGDVNGDGLADLIVGAWAADPNGGDSGSSYVVFGKADGTAVELSAVALGTGGFALHGAAQDDLSGRSVSGAGDVNGDGLADLIVGAWAADPNGSLSGSSYVVFGKADMTAVELSAVAAGTGGGFAVHGAALDDRSGYSVSGAGDVNGDGLADLIVGANSADPNGSLSGSSYVVFGKADGTAVELSAVATGIGGFALHGEGAGDNSGRSVSGAGDVNGDGLADLIVGAWRADPNGGDSGSSYVVFGKADGTAVELSAVASGTGGFALHGAAQFDYSGVSVSGAGDVNGDGLADLIVGARGARKNGNASGSSYVVFSDEIPELASMYLGHTLPGDGPGGDIVPATVFEDARMKVDFSDEDMGDNGSGGASLDMAVLYRSRAFVTNLVSAGVSTALVDAAWEFESDRVNWTDAQITAKYTDAELGALLNDESLLTVFTANALNGPWTELNPMIDLDTNEIAVTVGSSPNAQYFAIGLGTDVLWVNFGYEGTELGSRDFPLDTLQEAIDKVKSGGTINIDAFSPVTNSPGPITISKSMTIQAVDGKVSIGSP